MSGSLMQKAKKTSTPTTNSPKNGILENTLNNLDFSINLFIDRGR
jgi:hypothetical protein